MRKTLDATSRTNYTECFSSYPTEETNKKGQNNKRRNVFEEYEISGE